MKLVFCPKSYRERKSAIYHGRRLVYQAVIAKSMGHDVELHLPSGVFDFEPMPPDLKKLAGDLRITDGTKPSALPADAVYFCTTTYVLYAGNYVPKLPKIVVWNDTLACQHADKLFPAADLVLAWVTKPSDFTEPTMERHPGIKKYRWPEEGQPVMSVPFVSHDVVLEALWEDGMTDAYLRDDLEAIRAKYGSSKKKRLAGFIGGNLPVRSRIGATLEPPTYEVVWAGGHHPRLLPTDVLRWISESEACLNLPGDTYSCSRFCDAVLMGVPVIPKKDTLWFTPAVNESNTISVDNWANILKIRAGIEHSQEIVANADKAYREGWSLRGQLVQSLKRIGIA